MRRLRQGVKLTPNRRTTTDLTTRFSQSIAHLLHADAIEGSVELIVRSVSDLTNYLSIYIYTHSYILSTAVPNPPIQC